MGAAESPCAVVDSPKKRSMIHVANGAKPNQSLRAIRSDADDYLIDTPLFSEVLQRHAGHAAATYNAPRPDPKFVSHVRVEEHLRVIGRLEESDQLLTESEKLLTEARRHGDELAARYSKLDASSRQLEASNRHLEYERDDLIRRCQALEKDLQTSHVERDKLQRLCCAEQAARLAMQNTLDHKAQELADSHAACKSLASGLGQLTAVKNFASPDLAGKYEWCERAGFVRHTQ